VAVPADDLVAGRTAAQAVVPVAAPQGDAPLERADEQVVVARARRDRDPLDRGDRHRLAVEVVDEVLADDPVAVAAERRAIRPRSAGQVVPAAARHEDVRSVAAADRVGAAASVEPVRRRRADQLVVPGLAEHPDLPKVGVRGARRVAQVDPVAPLARPDDDRLDRRAVDLPALGRPAVHVDVAARAADRDRVGVPVARDRQHAERELGPDDGRGRAHGHGEAGEHQREQHGRPSHGPTVAQAGSGVTASADEFRARGPSDLRMDPTLAIGDPVDLDDACARLRALLAESPCVDCDVSEAAADARTVDVLARLQLVARRRRGIVRFVGADAPLRTLLELCGLSEELRCGPSGVEVRRQAEQREQARRVEEERDPGDRAV
jgi:hypothetical protein